MKIVAIISIRNNRDYLKVLLDYLKNNEINVILIDQASDDGSESIYSAYKDQHLLDVVKIPFDGSFSLSNQLEVKEKIRRSIDADWIIHHDSDEIMQSNILGESLRDMIVRINKEGYNTINLEEYVFIPEDSNVDYSNRNFLKEMRFYYCFTPAPMRLQRIFKNIRQNNSIESGGHQMIGEEVKIYPQSMILRHYIGLSFTKLIEKYRNRHFSVDEIDKGWHFNRVNVDWENVTLPDLEMFNFFPVDGISNQDPYKTHFWQWGENKPVFEQE